MDTREAGMRGGLARAKKLDQARRIEIGKYAAKFRWRRKNNKQGEPNL